MKLKWEIDAATVVEAALGAFGKKVITVNGKEVLRERNFGKALVPSFRVSSQASLPFTLPDGRAGVLSVEPRSFSAPQIELRVDGTFCLPTGKAALLCAECKAPAKPYDRFCERCGKALPGPEQRRHESQVGEATGAIRMLAWMFAAFGILLALLTRSQSEAGLARLANLAPTELMTLDGATYTVAQLRQQLIWEPWGVLLTNLVLAAAMAGLSIWGKKSPLPAVVVATAIYLVVMVVSAVLDPKSIGQGVIMKVLIIGMLVRGIKAALALRAADAAV